MDMYFKTAWKNHVKSVLLTAVLILILYSTYRIVNNLELNLMSRFLTGFFGLNIAAFVVLVLAAIIITHCAIHQIIYSLLNGSIFKGIKLSNYSLNGGSLKTLNRNHHALVELIPLAFVSAACAFIPGWVGQLIFACNILVSIGDVYNLLGSSMIKKYNYIKAGEPNHTNEVTEINI